MIRKHFHRLLPLLGVLLFGAALWVLHHQLKAHRYQDLLAAFRAIPFDRIVLAVVYTALGYLVLTMYDWLSIRYVSHPVSYPRTAMAAVIGYAFSNSMGHSFLTGGGVRYRLYSAWGLTAVDIAKVIIFAHVTFYLGTMILIGSSCLFQADIISREMHLGSLRFPVGFVQGVGGLMLALVLGYLVFSLTRRRPLRVRGWEFPVPSLPLSVAQVIVATLDLALMGAVLYVLLPDLPGKTFAGFIGLFMLSQVLAVGSQVPGGLGVFESLMMAVLAPPTEMEPAVLGGLLAFRIIYYIMPLGVGAVLQGLFELFEKKTALKRFARGAGRWVSATVPYVSAAGVFIAGALLLFSGATPSTPARLRWVHDLLPLTVIEISHFLGSLIGAVLLAVAHGLQRRLRAAYLVTLGLLGAGIALSLMKGLDWEEAIILALLLALLLPCRGEFYRKASLTGDRLTSGWIVATVLVFACAVFLISFSYKHVEYSSNLWWQFSLRHGDAPRSLRAMVGVAVVTLVIALARLLRPAAARVTLPDPKTLEAAQPVINASPNAAANLALLGDKPLLFNESGTAFIMYGIEGRSWVAMGDPVGPVDDWQELLWRFRELCDQHGDWPVFYQVDAARLPLYVDLGLTLLKLGEEARIHLPDFSLEGADRKHLRQSLNRLERDGLRFELIFPPAVDAILPEVSEVSDAWLAGKKTAEKGFSLGFFRADYIRRFPIAALRDPQQRLVAFANVWLGGGKHELSVDLMRHRPDAPAGVMDGLFVNLMLWGQSQGYEWFDFGMAPLAGLPDHELAPLWNRLGALVFHHGEHFYNFEGLRQYKDKFSPVWTPKYLASPAGLALPRILTNISTLISGGLRRTLGK